MGMITDAYVFQAHLYCAVTEYLLPSPLPSLLPSLPPSHSPSLTPSLSPSILHSLPSLAPPFSPFLSYPLSSLPPFLLFPPPFLPLSPSPSPSSSPLPLLPLASASHHQVMEELKMLKARNPFTPTLFVTLNLPTSDERAMEIEDRLIQDLNSIGYLSEDASMLPPEVHYPAQSPQVSSTAVSLLELCAVAVTPAPIPSFPLSRTLHFT